MILTRQAYERARRFVAAHGRALEAARLRLHFDGAPAAVALAELARYQNAHGCVARAFCQRPLLVSTAANRLARSSVPRPRWLFLNLKSRRLLTCR